MERFADKPAERPEPAPEPAARKDVKIDGSPTRCPFCHEGVDTSEKGWVACGGCMARHHEACWDERGACASCRGVRRLVAEERRAATDLEVVALVRQGDHARALAELRARGLDERAGRAALDLVGAALTGPRPADVGWTAAAVVYLLQTLALVVCAVLVAIQADVGAFSGLAVMVSAALALGIAAWLGRGSRPWLALLAFLNVAATVLGPLLIVGFDIGSHEGSPLLCLLALALTGGSAVLAGLSLHARKTSGLRQE